MQLKNVKKKTTTKKQLDSTDSKTSKSKNKNPLIYDSKYSFYKYRPSEFVRISSSESKFDTLEMFLQ